MSLEDAQFVETSRMSLADIAQFWAQAPLMTTNPKLTQLQSPSASLAA